MITDFLKTHVGLFQHFPDNRLDDIIQGSKLLSYELNEAVASFGEDASFLGVLIEGELSVWAVADDGSPREIGHFTTGDTFGEMALLSGDKIVYDYIAQTRCQVLRIPVDLFQSIIMTDPEALKHVSKTVFERFKKLSTDPVKAAAAFRQSADPYGLQLKRERP
jgi:CRP-like cAMP-binding protein